MTCFEAGRFFYRRTGKISQFFAYDEYKEGTGLKKKDLPVVHCTYCNTEKSVSEILEKSFRIYLGRILVSMEQPIVQCKR